jgi:hypothetical protein
MLADVQAVLAGLCQSLQNFTVQPSYSEVVDRAGGGLPQQTLPVLALDHSARVFNIPCAFYTLDRPFLALDHFRTSYMQSRRITDCSTRPKEEQQLPAVAG